MNRRNEMNKTFDPSAVDFKAVVKGIDWSREVTPVDLVKAVNKAEGLKGLKKYETNEKSFMLLTREFEKVVGSLVETRIHGKDRFYSLKSNVTADQLIGFVETGELKEFKKEVKKENSKFYFAGVPEAEAMYEEEVKKEKTTFPDNEALAKTAIILSMMLFKKVRKTCEFARIREEFGWKRQRRFDKKLFTPLQEVNRVTSELLGIGKILSISTMNFQIYGGVEDDVLEEKTNEVLSLMDDEVLKRNVIDKVKEIKEASKPEPKPEPVKVEEPKVEVKKPEPKVEPKPVKVEEGRPRIMRVNPELGKSEYKEAGTPTTPIFEGSKARWFKHLIGNALRGAERGTWYSFADISVSIKKQRFVDLSASEIKTLCGEIKSQFSGIFRTEYGGIIIGSEVLVGELQKSYPAEKITELIFVRLKMSLEELKESYPELKSEIASKISDMDNIFQIEMNRSEEVEKAFAKLVFRLRSGEVILESPSNWVVKRTKMLIEKLQNF